MICFSKYYRKPEYQTKKKHNQRYLPPQKATVRHENETSEEITIKRGVRQGCILSECIFNIHTGYCIRESLEDGKGTNINGQNITNIRYADDTIILAESEQQLQHYD